MTPPPGRPDPLAVDRVSSSAAAHPPSAGSVTAWYAEGLSDALGDRLLLFDTTGPGLELLRIDSRVAGLEGFEGALRANVESLRDFTHPSFARVRAVTWLDEPQPKLALVSEIVPGERLSNVLHAARVSGRRPDPAAVVSLLRQLLPALAALHAHGGAAHGLLAADRIVVTPDGELVITEHAIGAAVAAAAGGDEALRERLGLPAGCSDSVARTRHDVLQVGRLAVSMLLGRSARATDPDAWGEALDQATRIWGAALPPPLRAWLSRALALDRAPFDSARDAREALERLLPGGHLAPALPAGEPSAPPAAPDRSSSLLPSAARAVPTAPLPRAVSGAQPAPTPERADAPAPAAAAARPTPPPPVPPAPLALPSLFARVLTIERPAPRPTWTASRLTTLRLAAAGLAAVALVEAAVLMSILAGGSRGAAAPVDQTEVSGLQAPGDAQSAAPRRAGRSQRRSSVRSSDGRSAESAVVAAAALAGSPSLPAAAEDATKGAAHRDPPVIGWINVAAPSRVRVYANGRLLGATRASSFRLPAGDHEIAVVDEATGRRTDRAVRITAGRTLRLSIESFE